MIDRKIRGYLPNNFISAHKRLLEDKFHVDENMYKQNFGNGRVKGLYNKVISKYLALIYKYGDNNPNGNYDNELKFVETNELLDLVSKYEAMTGDKTFYKFLKIYVYLIEESNRSIRNRDGSIDNQKVLANFKNIGNFAPIMYDQVSQDIDAKNYWWLKDTATTLRRQLDERYTMISQSRLQKLFNKYFPRPFDVREIKNVDNATLMQELDIAMFKKYHTYPYYFWWAEDNNGNKTLMMDKAPPKSGVYTFVVYQNQTSKEVDDKDKGYYL